MMTWAELCEDKRFQDLPFKIEMNGRGQILMSPTCFYHGDFAGRIYYLFRELLPDGMPIVECAVETADGVREADVAWLSEELAIQMDTAAACPRAGNLRGGDFKIQHLRGNDDQTSIVHLRRSFGILAVRPQGKDALFRRHSRVAAVQTLPRLSVGTAEASVSQTRKKPEEANNG